MTDKSPPASPPKGTRSAVSPRNRENQQNLQKSRIKGNIHFDQITLPALDYVLRLKCKDPTIYNEWTG